MTQDLTPPLLSRRAALRTIGLGAAGVVLLACGGRTPSSSGGSRPATSGFEERFAEFQVADEPNGDLSKVVWPDFVQQAGGDVPQLYEFAVTHGPLLKWMACYCGCGRSDGHQSVRDCYVQQVNPDGSVVFSSMAPTWGVCLSVVRDTIARLDKGLTPREIRVANDLEHESLIDFATPTPYPPA